MDADAAVGRWSPAVDAASVWIHAHGPPGRYGARDAGVLGYELDGRPRGVVNLDGLVNDYRFVELVKAEATIWRHAARRDVDFFVGRLYPFDGMPACAREALALPARADGELRVAGVRDRPPGLRPAPLTDRHQRRRGGGAPDREGAHIVVAVRERLRDQHCGEMV